METEGREAEPRWEIPEARYRSELETAWLRGYRSGVLVGEGADQPEDVDTDGLRRAADYAERVVGGSTRPTRPKRPEVEQ